MRAIHFETVSGPSVLTELPLTLRQSTPLRASLGRLLVLVPTALALLAPFALLALHVVNDKAVRDQIVSQPASAVQIGLALGLWAVLFALPVQRSLAGLMRSREIKIDARDVVISDTGLLGRKITVAPLAGFSGLAHHVRASLSGTRHELILVHPRSEQSVILAVADHIHVAEIARVAALVGRPQIAAAALYRFATPAVPASKTKASAQASSHHAAEITEDLAVAA